MEAGHSTSHVEEVVEQPTSTPVTIIRRPSRAPIRSAAPVSIASIWPSSITYSKAVTLPKQSMSGSSSTKAPFNMEKECMFLKKVSVRPTAEPLHAMHKLVVTSRFSEEITGLRLSFSFHFSSVLFNVSTTVSLSVSHVVLPPFRIHESVLFSDVFPSVLPIVTCRILIHVSYLYLTWN
jgi:hypothetical protein